MATPLLQSVKKPPTVKNRDQPKDFAQSLPLGEGGKKLLIFDG